MVNTRFLYNNKVFGSMSDNDEKVNISNTLQFKFLNDAIERINYRFLSPKDKRIMADYNSDGSEQYIRDLEIGCFCEDTDYDY